MYHSITFGDKNTWDDWCLIPNGKPVFAPPKQKTNYLDIPGANGSLDMSEALTGYPVYENREGSFSFILMNKGAASYPDCNPMKFEDVCSELMYYVHGRTLEAILEDDPEYKYEGRFSVDNINPGADWSTIEIGYNVKPFKHSIRSTVDDWLWDPFNFRNDVIIKTLLSDIEVDTVPLKITLDHDLIGDEAVCPNFLVSSTNGQGVYVRLVNPTLNIDETHLFQNGTSLFNDFVLYGNNVDLYFNVSNGTGTVSVIFNQGRL